MANQIFRNHYSSLRWQQFSIEKEFKFFLGAVDINDIPTGVPDNERFQKAIHLFMHHLIRCFFRTNVDVADNWQLHDIGFCKTLFIHSLFTQ